MGCTSSKLDDLPAVSLCRERCAFLNEAIKQRFALAEAHLAYMQSLRTVGISLHRFFYQDLDVSNSASLNLSKDRKDDSVPVSKSMETNGLGHHSRSNSGHLQFHSDSDDEGESLNHSGNSSSLHHVYNDHVGYGLGNETLNSFPSGFMNMNYMKKQAIPSVSYEQRPLSHETVQVGQSSYYPYSDDYGYSNYGVSGINNYFGAPPPSHGGASSPPRPEASGSTSKPPPPMPSPERSSAWDIFNPFEYDKYYSAYTPSRDSKKVREEEGIPDLEDEDYRPEVVKEVYGDKKFVDGRGAGANYSNSVSHEEGRKLSSDHEGLYNARPKVLVENEAMEYEVHMVDKKVVESEKSGERLHLATFKGQGELSGALDVVTEIHVMFERASESGSELATMLEVGKHQYRHKHGAYQVSSKMLHVITPSLSVTTSPPSSIADTEWSSSTKTDSTLSGFEEETGIKLKNLSSVLQKLYLWEKKLYNEVKSEEKMRLLHDRKCEKLKCLDQKGAEAHKVETTRTLIRSLATKIKIAIQVVDKITVTINKIRDEELLPLINDLIQGLTRMWKSMLECHQNQCQTIKEARNLDAIASHKKPGDAQLEATMQLEHELIGLTLRFSSWIGAQKGYIKSLNNWLLKCLVYEPEETADGIAPFSPGRIGAPPVFVICNHWAQALERISEKEVVDSMRLFANTVLQFWERDKLVLRQGVVENKDLERKVRNMDRKDHKMQKEIQTLERKIMMVSGEEEQSVYQSDTSSISSLQASLQHIFEAMERFTASSTRAYEEILQRSKEDVRPQENVTVS